MNKNSIIILTPIKNEEWVIGGFLDACSVFADHIILLVQDTDDRSREISAQYPKARVIENSSNTFSERSRIQQLLSAAREIEPGPRVLVALDADEIPINTPEALEQWNRIRELPAGGNITFKKPDLLPAGATIVDLQEDWILGFVDDDREHIADDIHSIRVPVNNDREFYSANSIPILHVNLVRTCVNLAKRRMYCTIENIHQSQSLLKRLYHYHHKVNFSAAAEIIPLPKQWRDLLLLSELDPYCIPEEAPFWQDYQVLRYFKEHGVQRFHWDDIWTCDWESIRQQCIANGWDDVPSAPIQHPSCLVNFTRTILIRLVGYSIKIKRKLFKLFGRCNQFSQSASIGLSQLYPLCQDSISVL